MMPPLRCASACFHATYYDAIDCFRHAATLQIDIAFADDAAYVAADVAANALPLP